MTGARGAARRAALVAVVGLAGGVGAGGVGAGCAGEECRARRDCAAGFVCTVDGRCVESGEGTVSWVSPEPGSQVDEHFDVVLDVRFRDSAAELLVDRAVDAPGDPCAPSVPQRLVIAGDATAPLAQRVTIPGMRALGERFHIAATLRGGGGIDTAVAELRGPAMDFGGAVFEAPEGATAPADQALTVPVSASFDGAVVRASLWVEPVGLDGRGLEPSAREIVGSAVTRLTDAVAPLARGPQILWLEVEDGADIRRCGRGLSGGGDAATAPGLELGLFYEGGDPGLLDLRVRVGGEGEPGCGFADPGASCEPVRETRGPARRGEEVLRVHGDGIVDVAVVPGAAGPPLTARVRVSMNGAHVGWLGPFAIQPALGEVWVAGTVVVTGALADLQRTDDVVIGAPF